jgi:hypothetical protein
MLVAEVNIGLSCCWLVSLSNAFVARLHLKLLNGVGSPFDCRCSLIFANGEEIFFGDNLWPLTSLEKTSV